MPRSGGNDAFRHGMAASGNLCYGKNCPETKILHSATRRTKNPNQPHAHEPPPHIREREKREKETERKRDREKEREREREREHGDVVKTIGFTNISKQTQPMCQFALSSLRMKM